MARDGSLVLLTRMTSIPPGADCVLGESLGPGVDAMSSHLHRACFPLIEMTTGSLSPVCSARRGAQTLLRPLPSVCALLGWQPREGSHSCGLLSGALVDSCVETHKLLKPVGVRGAPQELLWALSPPAAPGAGLRWQLLWLWEHRLFFQLQKGLFPATEIPGQCLVSSDVVGKSSWQEECGGVRGCEQVRGTLVLPVR